MAVSRAALAVWVPSAVIVFLILHLITNSITGTTSPLSRFSGLSQGGPKPRYIFVDLGANAGDSLLVFLQDENAKFEYEFPRPDWATYDEAEIYLFEANPYFNTALVKAKEAQAARGVKVNIFPSTVVDVKDGTRTFYLDTVSKDRDYWGSSIYADATDVQNSNATGTELTAINISRWLLMNTLPQDFVVVKMDIEGAEYEVVPHMVEMSIWNVVDYLLVEWHFLMSKTQEENTVIATKSNEAHKYLVSKGVQMPDYNSPA